MECSCHEGVILGNVCKYDELCTTDRVVVTCEVSGSFNNSAHELDSVHIDSGFCCCNIYRGANEICFGENLGNDRYHISFGGSYTLMYECRKASDEVYSEILCRSFECVSDFYISFGRDSTADKRDGSYRDTFVDDRNTVVLFDSFSCFYQILCLFCDLVIDLVTEAVFVLAYAVEERDAHSYGTDIQVLLAYHIYRFKYVFCIDHFSDNPFGLKYGAWH